MKRKLVDPVHFFDQTGVSMLSGRHLQERNAALEKENERLLDIIRRMQAKLKQTDPEQDLPNFN